MILLSAGHYPAAPGACFGDFCEHAEAVRWVGQTAVLIRQQMRVDIVPSGALAAKVAHINSYRREPVLLACEIHFNSDPSHQGHGSETLYCPGSAKSRRAAEIVQSALGRVLPPDRGTKEGWYRMDKPGHEDYPGDVDGDEKPDYFLAATNPVALIVEPAFIHDRDLIERMRAEACEALATALLAAAKEMA